MILVYAELLNHRLWCASLFIPKMTFSPGGSMFVLRLLLSSHVAGTRRTEFLLVLVASRFFCFGTCGS